MRIAQVAPLFVPIPPQNYGGTERVIHDLTEALVARGHDVTLFASGDSQTSARLAAAVPRGLWREHASAEASAAAHFRMHAEVFRHAAEFDVIHTHTEYLSLPYIRQSPAAVLTTLHGRVDVPELRAIFRLFPEARLVSISRAHQAQAPEVSWAGSVHHGLALERYAFNPIGGEGLVFLGRMCPEKAPQEAIDVALAAGVPLTLAGRIDPLERAFFEREVRTRLDRPRVRFIGEVGDKRKELLLGRARALIFPIDWPEPFGLVMAEAMACGTPVIARPCGAAPELIVDGVTGFLADSREALIEAVREVGCLDRAACRRHIEKNFSVATMTERYEEIYAGLLKRSERRMAAGARASAIGR
jgi:glycosyltransferase involved in cell wall biosynthesis